MSDESKSIFMVKVSPSRKQSVAGNNLKIVGVVVWGRKSASDVSLGSQVGN